MASYYDSKKKCRVGTMDEAQFRAESSPEAFVFFSAFLKDWKKAGGTLKWGAGGVGLRGSIGDKEVGICFLAPKYAGKSDRIELACASLTKQLGPQRLARLVSTLREAASERVLGKSMISVVDPGTLPHPAQQALVEAFLETLA